jgi:hypothetical protein
LALYNNLLPWQGLKLRGCLFQRINLLVLTLTGFDRLRDSRSMCAMYLLVPNGIWNFWGGLSAFAISPPQSITDCRTHDFWGRHENHLHAPALLPSDADLLILHCMDEIFYFLHFTGHDGIRDLRAIGESTRPIFVEFDTGPSQYNPGNRTEVGRQRPLPVRC